MAVLKKLSGNCTAQANPSVLSFLRGPVTGINSPVFVPGEVDLKPSWTLHADAEYVEFVKRLDEWLKNDDFKKEFLRGFLSTCAEHPEAAKEVFRKAGLSGHVFDTIVDAVFEFTEPGRPFNDALANVTVNIAVGMLFPIWGGAIGAFLGGLPGAAYLADKGYTIGYNIGDFLFDNCISPPQDPTNNGEDSDRNTDGGYNKNWEKVYKDWKSSHGVSFVPPDPLVFDLDRDGKIDLSRKGYFDLDVNGFAEHVSWVGGGDGILVMDRNGDGIINDGRELFGDQTILSNGTKAANGFMALADLDETGDGVIDANDEAYGNLRMWADFDEDGSIAADEFRTLGELGIISINLSVIFDGAVDEFGNSFGDTGSFTWSDESVGKVSEALLQTDKMHSMQMERIPISDEVSRMANLSGMGSLYSLHQTMMRDESGSLKTLIENFSIESDEIARKTLFEEILFKWAELNNASTEDRGPNISSQKLGFLELFFGEAFVGAENTQTPNPTAATVLSDVFGRISSQYYAELMAQTHHKELFDSVAINYDMDSNEFYYDLTGITEQIRLLYVTDPEQAMKKLSEFVDLFLELGYGNNITEQGMTDVRESLAEIDPSLSALFDDQFRSIINFSNSGEAAEIVGSAGNDVLIGGWGNDTLIGGAGNDSISGGSGDDRIDGGAGNDVLVGGFGDDTLVGGSGDDSLYGADGNDTYIWNVGDGKDIIRDEYGQNVLKIGEGIDPSGVSITREANDLVFLMGESGERVTVNHWYNNTNAPFQLSEVQFSDGTVWSRDEINAMSPIISGTEGDDTLSGFNTNDTLIGGAGNDVLVGGFGDDTLVGGSGDDSLYGADGNDTYIWNVGDGKDIIRDEYGQNVLKIGEGIDPSGVSITREANDLVFLMGESGERVTVNHWYNNTNAPFQLSEVQFSDGTVWSRDDVNDIASGGGEPFSTVAPAEDAPEISPSQFISTNLSDEEMEEALSLLSTQSESASVTEGDFSRSQTLPNSQMLPVASEISEDGMPSVSDPHNGMSFVSVIDKPECGSTSTETSQLAFEVAVAQLHFAEGDAEQICEVSSTISTYADCHVSIPVDQICEEYFTLPDKEQRSA